MQQWHVCCVAALHQQVTHKPSHVYAGRKNGQDAKWLQQVRRSGTTSDKVAALTLLLQENAVANLRSLDALLTWVLKRKGGRNVVAQVHVWTRE